MTGKLQGNKAVFAAAIGKRYLGGRANEFSATSQYPPKGQKEGKAVIENGKLTGSYGKKTFELERLERKSPSLGQGTQGRYRAVRRHGKRRMAGRPFGRADQAANTDGRDIRTARNFKITPCTWSSCYPSSPPRAKGRGNSGFYQVDHYEVQIHDSFGLEGKNNECDGVYTKADPIVNMCLPPLQWQTYDVEFTNAVMKDGKKIKNARMTLKHNGVVIHKDLEINGKTGGSRATEGTPGPIKLQGHGNPLNSATCGSWRINNQISY